MNILKKDYSVIENQILEEIEDNIDKEDVLISLNELIRGIFFDIQIFKNILNKNKVEISSIINEHNNYIKTENFKVKEKFNNIIDILKFQNQKFKETINLNKDKDYFFEVMDFIAKKENVELIKSAQNKEDKEKIFHSLKLKFNKFESSQNKFMTLNSELKQSNGNFTFNTPTNLNKISWKEKIFSNTKEKDNLLTESNRNHVELKDLMGIDNNFNIFYN